MCLCHLFCQIFYLKEIFSPLLGFECYHLSFCNKVTLLLKCLFSFFLNVYFQEAINIIEINYKLSGSISRFNHLLYIRKVIKIFYYGYFLK